MRDHLLKFIQTLKSWDMLSTIGCFYNLLYGYGSIPIDTFLVGWTSIYQLFWGSLGIKVLTHCHIITVNTGLFRVGFCSMGGIPTSDLRLDPVGPSSWPFTFRNRKMFRKINGSTHGRKVAPKKNGLPSGKHTKSYWKSPSFFRKFGKSTISMGNFLCRKL